MLRFVQGFGVGGEWGGAVLMAVEHAPAGARGFYASWPQVGVPAGLLLATAVFALFARLPEEEFLRWGWRVPFLLGIVLVGVGLFIRLRMLETPVFTRVAEDAARRRRSRSWSVLRRHPREVLLAMGARFAENGAFYIFTVFVLVYGTRTRRDGRAGDPERRADRLGAAQLVSDPALRRVVGSAGPTAGVSRRRARSRALFAFPFFWLVDTRLDCARRGWRSSWRSSGTRRCMDRRRRSSPSCSARASATAAPRSAISSRRWSPAGSRRSSPPRSFCTAEERWPAYIIAMALVTIVSVLIASETRDRVMD